MTTKHCRVCDKLLTDENWNPYARKRRNYKCKYCIAEYNRLWREKNPDKAKAIATRANTIANRKNGMLPMNENKDCASYLGVCVNERLIRHRFNDLVVMPTNNHGFDFICNKGMKVDGKSSCLHNDGRWTFNIGRNTIADDFLCVAYDNRVDLNIVHVWMIPGKDINHLLMASIRPSTVHKWDAYIYDIEGFSACCNEMKDIARDE